MEMWSWGCLYVEVYSVKRCYDEEVRDEGYYGYGGGPSWVPDLWGNILVCGYSNDYYLYKRNIFEHS